MCRKILLWLLRLSVFYTISLIQFLQKPVLPHIIYDVILLSSTGIYNNSPPSQECPVHTILGPFYLLPFLATKFINSWAVANKGIITLNRLRLRLMPPPPVSVKNTIIYFSHIVTASICSNSLTMIWPITYGLTYLIKLDSCCAECQIYNDKMTVAIFKLW